MFRGSVQGEYGLGLRGLRDWAFGLNDQGFIAQGIRHRISTSKGGVCSHVHLGLQNYQHCFGGVPYYDRSILGPEPYSNSLRPLYYYRSRILIVSLTPLNP